MNWKRGLVVALALAMLVPPAVAMHSQRAVAEQQDQYPAYGVPVDILAFMWSHDVDDGQPSGMTQMGRFQVDDVPARGPLTKAEVFRLAQNADNSYTIPKSYAAQWSHNSLSAWTGSQSGAREAVVPEGAEESDDGRIKDSHATIFRVTPATRYHGGSGPLTYTKPEGAVRGIVDWRAEILETKVNGNPPEGDVVYRRTSYKLIQSTLTTQSLHVLGNGSARVGFRTRNPADLHPGPQKTVRMTFNINKVDDVDFDELEGFQFSASIRLRYLQTVLEMVEKEVDIPKTNETVTIRVPRHSVSIETNRTTVRDSVDAAPYDLSSENVEVYAATQPEQFGDGSGGRYAVLLDENAPPVTGYELPTSGDYHEDGTQQQVYSEYRLITAQDLGFQTMTEYHQTGPSTVETTSYEGAARPVRMHAYPSSIGTFTSPVGVDTPEIKRNWTTKVDAPESMPEDFNISLAGSDAGSFQQLYGWDVLFPGVTQSEVQNTPIRLLGLVRESNVTVEPDEIEQRQIRESELSVEVIEQSENETTLRVELTDAKSGDYISLDGSRTEPIGGVDAGKGRIVVRLLGSNEQRIIKGTGGGPVHVTFSRDGVYQAKYQPAGWLEKDPAYLPSKAQTKAQYEIAFLDLLLWFLWHIVIPFAPIGVAWIKTGAVIEIIENQQL